MLRRFQPELLEPPGAAEALGPAGEGELGEIRITRTAGTEAARPPFADPA